MTQDGHTVKKNNQEKIKTKSNCNFINERLLGRLQHFLQISKGAILVACCQCQLYCQKLIYSSRNTFAILSLQEPFKILFPLSYIMYLIWSVYCRKLFVILYYQNNFFYF